MTVSHNGKMLYLGRDHSPEHGRMNLGVLSLERQIEPEVSCTVMIFARIDREEGKEKNS